MKRVMARVRMAVSEKGKAESLNAENYSKEIERKQEREKDRL